MATSEIYIGFALPFSVRFCQLPLLAAGSTVGVDGRFEIAAKRGPEVVNYVLEKFLRLSHSGALGGTVAAHSELPRCSCGALQRPHIVWFGEIPFDMHVVKRRVQACDLFITVGSSGVVYPAAGLVREIVYRRQQGEACRSVYVGLERPDNAADFDEVVLGRAGEVLPALLAA